MIKVIVFSDIKIYCDGLSRILANTNPIQVIAAESNFNDAVAKIKQDSPDVILLDMTKISGLEFSATNRQITPGWN